jgi:hypothetical protein
LERKGYVPVYHFICWKWLKTSIYTLHYYSTSFGICCLHNYFVKQKWQWTCNSKRSRIFKKLCGYDAVHIASSSFKLIIYSFESSPSTSKHNFSSFTKISLKRNVDFSRKFVQNYTTQLKIKYDTTHLYFHRRLHIGSTNKLCVKHASKVQQHFLFVNFYLMNAHKWLCMQLKSKALIGSTKIENVIKFLLKPHFSVAF